MKIIELQKKTTPELKELLYERRRRADEMEALLREKKVKNVKEMREVKKDIARILTILTENPRLSA